jgi:hypothetical protein
VWRGLHADRDFDPMKAHLKLKVIKANGSVHERQGGASPT